MRTRFLSTFAAVSALALASCSGTDSNDTSNGDTIDQSSGADAAEDAPSALSCLRLPTRDARKDNDIMNIDLGMSADDALKIAQCNDEGLAVNVSDEGAPALPDGSKPRVQISLQKEDDLVNVFLMGMPGEEKVYGLVRVKTFAEGTEPTVAQMRTQLLDKYGPLVPDRTFGADYRRNAENLNEQAQALSPDGQPLFKDIYSKRDCAEYFGQNDSLAQLSGDCGFTKKMEIRPKYGNDGLASGFSVWIGDQRAIMMAMQSLGQKLRALQSEEREAERQEAESSDRLPDL